MEKSQSILLKQMQGSLGGMTYELRIRYLTVEPEQTWTPAINAFQCRNHFVVCADLAGVEKDQIEIRVEPRRLLLRGIRQSLDCTGEEGPPLQVFALEIDQGVFQREIALPRAVDPENVRAEHRHGLLWIYLPLVP